MLRGQGGYKIRLELAIRTPGCPLNTLLPLYNTLHDNVSE